MKNERGTKMSKLERLEQKYGVPRLIPTYMILSQFEVDVDEELFPDSIKPIIPSDALIYESFHDAIDVSFKGRFITNLLPSVESILIDIMLLPEESNDSKDAVEVATNLLVANKESITDISPMAAFNLSGKFAHLKLSGPGLLSLNLKFIINDSDISSDVFPVSNTICMIPVIFNKEGEVDGDGK